MNICSECDNEFEWEAYFCPNRGCETTAFCGEQCQLDHMTEHDESAS